MIVLQVVPRGGRDAYKLLRDKVTHEAQTWSWKNKAKTRLSHSSPSASGYIEVSSADGVVIAQVRPTNGADPYFLTEKFIGRLVAWFKDELLAIQPR
jgi:hypothetical protein